MEASVTTFLIGSLATLVIVVCVQSLLWKRRFKEQQGGESQKPLPPGSMGWPFVGETLHFLFKGFSLFYRKHAQYGHIYKMHLFGSPTIRVSGAEFIRELTGREPKALDVLWPKSSRDLLGERSLPVVKGEEHGQLRKMIQEAFNPTRLSDYVPCIQEHVRANLLSWSQRGKMLGVPGCESLVADIMTEVLLGYRKENDNGRKVQNALITINSNLFCLPLRIPGLGYQKSMDARKVVSDFVQARLEGRGDKDHVCMLDVFLAQHGLAQGMTDRQVLDNAMALFIVGTGTTSAALGLCLLMLGQYPEVVLKIRQELEDNGLLGKHVDESLTYEVLQKLSFVQGVEKEILRVHPPVGGAYRKMAADIETQEFTLPKDWSLIYSFRTTHETTDVFENREAFQPERWLDPDLQTKLKFEKAGNYVPFGAGNRTCIGRQLARLIMHVFLVESVRLVEWHLHNPKPTMAYRPSTEPSDRLPVTFTARPVD